MELAPREEIERRLYGIERDEEELGGRGGMRENAIQRIALEMMRG